MFSFSSISNILSISYFFLDIAIEFYDCDNVVFKDLCTERGEVFPRAFKDILRPDFESFSFSCNFSYFFVISFVVELVKFFIIGSLMLIGNYFFAKIGASLVDLFNLFG